MLVALLGVRAAGVAALLMAIGIALLAVPEGAVLRSPEAGLIKGSPFLKGIVALMRIGRISGLL